MSAKRYVSKIVKFMLSNPADLKRLDALSGISFSKYVKGKLDCDAAGAAPIPLLQAQVTRLEREIGELRTGVAPRSSVIAKEEAFVDKPDVDKWFETVSKTLGNRGREGNKKASNAVAGFLSGVILLNRLSC
jgi:hypothetical protein